MQQGGGAVAKALWHLAWNQMIEYGYSPPAGRYVHTT